VVIGVGGLGHMAVQILRAVSAARVIAVDKAPDKLQLAREVGADETVEAGAVVGLAGGTIEFGFRALPFDATLTVPYWGSAIELMEVLDLARRGDIRAHVERFSLDDASRAYERLREGSIEGRAVICPGG
jgi:propanol-preferring alcohol dehydrogenase